MDKITGLLGDGAVGNILEDQIRDKAADAAGEKGSDQDLLILLKTEVFNSSFLLPVFSLK